MANDHLSMHGLNRSIRALENDMVAIRSEHDTQNRRVHAQKMALDGVISDLGAVNMMGKDKDTTSSRLASPMATPALESEEFDASMDNGGRSYNGEDSPVELEESGEVEKEIGTDEDSEAVLLSTSSSLNATAPPFMPLQSLSTREDLEDDIEMGEVAEDPKVKGKKKIRDEELEEGEASDSSSALSDPPSD